MNDPKFKKGDKCIYVYRILEDDKFLSILDYDMTISDNPWFYEQYNIWYYPIKGKANDCPEYFLRIWENDIDMFYDE